MAGQLPDQKVQQLQEILSVTEQQALFLLKVSLALHLLRAYRLTII
jgi:hypothetical protein